MINERDNNLIPAVLVSACLHKRVLLHQKCDRLLRVDPRAEQTPPIPVGPSPICGQILQMSQAENNP